MAIIIDRKNPRIIKTNETIEKEIDNVKVSIDLLRKETTQLNKTVLSLLLKG